VTEFAEPWEAQVFALVVALNERGLLPWPEWTAALAAELGEGESSDYEAWLSALEKLVSTRFADADTLAFYRAAWAAAAERTPHGEPIVPDFGSSVEQRGR
jgi:nitrile hydratase accessory protein